GGIVGEGVWRERGSSARRGGLLFAGWVGDGSLRQPSAGIGTDDGPLPTAEWIYRFVPVAHRRSSRIAQRYSSSSGQSPEKCKPIDAALLKSGQSGDFLSR